MSTLFLADLVALVGGTVLSFGPSAPGPNGPAVSVEAQVSTVLIDGDRIVDVGPDLELPPGTRQVDVSGLFLAPGLIDGFVQFDGDNDALYTLAGVTTVRDVGGDRARLLRLREHRDGVPGPKLLTAGVVLGGEPAASPEAAVFKGAVDAERLLPLLFADQVDFLSTFPNLPSSAWWRTIELAHENELTVWGPTGPGVGMDFGACLNAGQDGFFYVDSLLPKGVDWDIVQPMAFKKNIKRLVESGAGLVPMMRATASRLDKDLGPAEEEARYFRYLGSHYAGWWISEKQFRMQVAAENPDYIKTGQRVLDKQMKVLAMMAEAGVQLVPGSGSPHPWLMPGAGLVDELELWQTAGLAPAQLLYLATAGAADAMGQGTDLGRIEAGRVADIICLTSDPRETVGNLRDPKIVVVRGDVNEPEDLADMRTGLLQMMAERHAKETAPLDVAPPSIPEGETVLEGFLESRARGVRVSAERWAVVREPDGTTAFCGRVVTPPEGSFLGTDLNVIQRVRDGKLIGFQLTLTQEKDRLVLTAEWAAERFNIDRRLNGVFVDNKRTPEHALAIDVGSVTTAMVLGQLKRTGRFPAIKLHESFEAEVVAWQMEIAEDNVHLVQTSTGGLGFEFDSKGGLKTYKLQEGEQIMEMSVLEQSSFGGPGYPVPAKAPTLKQNPAGAGAEPK